MGESKLRLSFKNTTRLGHILRLMLSYLPDILLSEELLILSSKKPLFSTDIQFFNW